MIFGGSQPMYNGGPSPFWVPHEIEDFGNEQHTGQGMASMPPMYYRSPPHSSSLSGEKKRRRMHEKEAHLTTSPTASLSLLAQVANSGDDFSDHGSEDVAGEF